MKCKLLVLFLCLVAFKSRGQVDIRPINHYHAISGVIGAYSNLELYTDSVEDFNVETWISDVPHFIECRAFTSDTALAITGSGLSFGDLGNLDTGRVRFYISSVQTSTVDTSIQYLGLKKYLQADTFYGWLSYKLTGGKLVFFPLLGTYACYDSLLFIDVAWSTSPNSPLPAGHDCYAILPDTVSTCQGTTTTLTATGGNDFLWSTGQTGDAISIVTFQDTTYSVTATGTGGCVDSASIFVKALPAPVAEIQPDTGLEICTGDTLTVTAQGGVSYNWNTGDTTNSFSIFQPGSYAVTAAGISGCTDSTSVSVTSAGNYPIADFDFTISEDTARFENMSLDATDYYWTFGDNATSNNVDPEHVFSQDSVYQVCLTVSNNCGSDSTCKVVPFFFSGIHTESESKVGVYFERPLLNIFIYSGGSIHFQSIRLLSISGQELVTVLPSPNTHRTTVNIKHLSPGLYLCVIAFSNGKVVVKKVVVE